METTYSVLFVIIPKLRTSLHSPLNSRATISLDHSRRIHLYITHKYITRIPYRTPQKGKCPRCAPYLIKLARFYWPLFASFITDHRSHHPWKRLDGDLLRKPKQRPDPRFAHWTTKRSHLVMQSARTILPYVYLWNVGTFCRKDTRQGQETRNARKYIISCPADFDWKMISLCIWPT